MKRRPGVRAFSLIEILFTVALIAILAMFLLPRLVGGKDPLTKKTIAAPKERAEQVVGINNTAQIGQAIQMYRIDHDGQNPPTLADLRAYGVTDDLLLDPVTRQPLSYDPVTGAVGTAKGLTGLGGLENLPPVGAGGLAPPVGP